VPHRLRSVLLFAQRDRSWPRTASVGEVLHTAIAARDVAVPSARQPSFTQTGAPRDRAAGGPEPTKRGDAGSTTSGSSRLLQARNKRRRSIMAEPIAPEQVVLPVPEQRAGARLARRIGNYGVQRQDADRALVEDRRRPRRFRPARTSTAAAIGDVRTSRRLNCARRLTRCRHQIDLELGARTGPVARLSVNAPRPSSDSIISAKRSSVRLASIEPSRSPPVNCSGCIPSQARAGARFRWRPDRARRGRLSTISPAESSAAAGRQARFGEPSPGPSRAGQEDAAETAHGD